MKLNRFFKLAAAALAFVSCSTSPKVAPAIPQDKEIEAKIEKILKKMTLEEKIGQMTQVTVTAVANGADLTAAGDSIIRTYKVGSILNTPGDIAQRPEDYNKLIKELNRISMEEMGIPCLYGLDHIHGTSYVLGGVLFPQEIGIAATFNREHAYNMGKVTAYESRAANVPWTFSPTMDLGRNPAWPRMWESFGEDAYVNAAMAVAEVRGMQGEDPNHVGPYNIAACAKHFMGYGVPVTGQDRTPSSIAASELREKHFEPFKEAMQAGALSIMVNSASNNGMPFHCNTELLTQWVKEDLNWDGMIVTDWADIDNLYTRERIAVSRKDAVRLAINAGIDMAMIPNDWQFCKDLVALVNEGAVPMERIDDAVRRVLRLKFRLGLFDNPNWDLDKYEKFGSEEFRQMSYRAAVESEVLLKNEGGILPLEKGTRILVTGPNANEMRCLNGGWSYTWQGDMANEYTEHFNTIYEALQNEYGVSNVSYEPGVTYVPGLGKWQQERCSVESIAKAVQAARGCDVIVACIGENSYCETPGNVEDINLSANQKNLVRAIAKTGKPVVLVLNGGRPRIINDIEPLAQAVVEVILPGNYGGDALAALLSGRENFSGKLPFTYPKYINMLSTYDYKVSEVSATMEGVYNYDARIDVLWPFGYGLSYTTFTYGDIQLASSAKVGETIKVVVPVTNSGKMDGDEIIQVYLKKQGDDEGPIKALRAFKRVNIPTGKTVNVELELTPKQLEWWNPETNTMCNQAGNFDIMVGCDSENVQTKTIALQ